MGFVPETQSDIDESFQQGHKMILFADCSSSTRGMFLGLIILSLTVIGCIIVIVIMDDCNDNVVIEITLIFESILFATMTIASIALYYRLGWSLMENLEATNKHNDYRIAANSL